MELQKRQKNHEVKSFKANYFAVILLLTVLFSIVGINLVRSGLILASEIQVLIIYIITAFLFALSALIFNRFKQKLEKREGFFFLLSSVFKMIITAIAFLSILKFSETKNHFLTLLFLISYITFMVYDVSYKINIFKE